MSEQATRELHRPRGLCLYVLAAMLFVALSMHLPVSLFATASHDDALFFAHADSIITGHWLGPFNQLTLAKGPAYSLFLAINTLLGIPVTLSIAVLYAFACWALVTVLVRIGLPRVAAIGLFLALLFQPALFPTRIIRDNIYPALTLLTIAGVISVGSHRQSTGRTILFGFILGLFWITREEGLWILPGIALYFLSALTSNREPDDVRRHLLFRLGVYLLAALIPCAAVSTLNYVKYGTFEVGDFKNSSFEKTLGLLNSIVVKDELPYVPVPLAKRELAYGVSPAFRQLEDYFEGVGRAWMQPGCQIYPQTCGDYAGGWFMWALRDAVAGKGHYRSPRQAEAFYREIAAEISMACKTGTVKCRSNYLPFLPDIPPETLARIPATAVKALQVSLYQTTVPSTDGTNNGHSLGGAAELDRIRRFLGNPKSMPATDEMPVLAKNADPVSSRGDGVPNIDEKISDETVYATPLAIKQGLATIYRWVTTPIAGLGVLCYFGCLGFSFVKKRAPGRLFWIASMLWLVYLARMALIMLVDLTSFPAANYFYLAPALPILYAAAIVSISSMHYMVAAPRRADECLSL